MRTFYPEKQLFKTHNLKVDSTHTLYIEEVGNPEGKPIVFLHGGPGGGITSYAHRFFDPSFYRIILFDQRGAGRSTPHASLENNTTWDLVSDMEKIREFLGVDSWVVFGGSWGSTLALSYAETHPTRTRGLILRGIFLCRKEEINWFYQEGASFIFPDEYDKYVAPIPTAERGDLVKAFYKRLTSQDEATRLEAAKAWSVWEGSTLRLIQDPETISKFGADAQAVAMARIECHFFTNNTFFDVDGQLLQNVHKIRNIPTRIVHGRYDVVCPVKNAFDLKKAFPEAVLEVIADAGHAANEPGIVDALVRATDDFKLLY